MRRPFFFSSAEPRAIVHVCSSFRTRGRYESVEGEGPDGFGMPSAVTARGRAADAAAAAEERMSPRRERGRERGEEDSVMAGLWWNPGMYERMIGAIAKAVSRGLAATLSLLLIRRYLPRGASRCAARAAADGRRRHRGAGPLRAARRDVERRRPGDPRRPRDRPRGRRRLREGEDRRGRGRLDSRAGAAPRVPARTRRRRTRRSRTSRRTSRTSTRRRPSRSRSRSSRPRWGSRWKSKIS